MEFQSLIRDSLLASLACRLSGGPDSSRPGRVRAGGSLAAVLASVAGSITAYGMLPETMRIHWTLGMGPYYGPEFASTLLVLTLFPVLIAGTAGLAHSIDLCLRDGSEFAAIRSSYTVAVLGTLGALLVSQALLILVNL